MTYPLIGNYGITPDMESERPWPDGYIVRELDSIAFFARITGSGQDKPLASTFFIRLSLLLECV